MKRFLLAVLALSLGAAVAGQTKRTLHLYNWPDYMDPYLMREFEHDFNVNIKTSLYGSQGEMIKGLLAPNTYDVVFPSQYSIQTMIDKKLILPIDAAQIPNRFNLSRRFLNPQYDANNRHSYAYFWGTTGVGFRADMVTSTPRSFAVIFDPARSVGPFGLIDDGRVMVGFALKYLGKPYNSLKPQDLQQAETLLATTVKRAEGIFSVVNVREKIIKGKVALALMYSVDALVSRTENPNINYFMPEEGGEIWVDNMVIGKKSKNVALAHAFINFMLKPKNAARNAETIRAATPNQTATGLLSFRDRSSPIMYPDNQALLRSEYAADLGEKIKVYDEIWARVTKNFKK